jgi:hypothetical protein
VKKNKGKQPVPRDPNRIPIPDAAKRRSPLNIARRPLKLPPMQRIKED